MRTLLALVTVLGVAGPALATPTMQPIKIGVIDFTKLFNETARAKVDKAELDDLLSKRQSEVDARKLALEKARAELATRASSMDPLARARRQSELDAEAAALHQLFDEAQKQVQARERELSGRVVSDARAIAPEVAQRHGVSLVLGAAEALLWTAPSVVQVDLTSEVAKALDRRVATKP